MDKAASGSGEPLFFWPAETCSKVRPPSGLTEPPADIRPSNFRLRDVSEVWLLGKSLRVQSGKKREEDAV